MENLTERELNLLLHLRALKPGEAAEFESPDMAADFEALNKNGYLYNVIDNSVGNKKSYRFN
ncbi:hypothetical protein B1B04_13840 [Lysinibacillus sp. KCTC 33748]|uniref:hypothetical protein n=1 Tax=unclassified Lysinibacillus TaxID=2636778 RepID=UPI0009A6106C|nr:MULTISPECIES: hypothetical protein [unclassified Lysinibacillus]OXS73040.1 hypothetical protein B1B04_13840 [Lysinibacillus sp. KCTC 33748]SKB86459.1 hypothetical protein SAMN06295926_11087 [Lysinibacillus sp. AC-3]